MEIRERNPFPRAHEKSPYALGIVTAIAVAAGFAMVVAWFVLLVLEDERRSAPAARSENSSCGVCGVVERVREVEPAPRQALEGSRAEGAVILLAALGGLPASGARQATIYETSVLHDDGSVRVLRDSSAPQWTPGDRVKVIKGRVEPAASPAGRISTPGPQAARGW